PMSTSNSITHRPPETLPPPIAGDEAVAADPGADEAGPSDHAGYTISRTLPLAPPGGRGVVRGSGGRVGLADKLYVSLRAAARAGMGDGCRRSSLQAVFLRLLAARVVRSR